MLALGGTALADDLIKIDLTIKDHRFVPAEIHLPTGKAALLTIKNDDPTPEEFESAALKAEKVVPGAFTVTIRLRPLGPGRFPFIGEYHPDTAQGTVVVGD
jgi:hypothetical protein